MSTCEPSLSISPSPSQGQVRSCTPPTCLCLTRPSPRPIRKGAVSAADMLPAQKAGTTAGPKRTPIRVRAAKGKLRTASARPPAGGLVGVAPRSGFARSASLSLSLCLSLCLCPCLSVSVSVSVSLSLRDPPPSPSHQRARCRCAQLRSGSARGPGRVPRPACPSLIRLRQGDPATFCKHYINRSFVLIVAFDRVRTPQNFLNLIHCVGGRWSL